MKKVLCMIALAAISYGSVYAAPVQTKDTVKVKEKVKKNKVKIKKKVVKKDTTKM